MDRKIAAIGIERNQNGATDETLMKHGFFLEHCCFSVFHLCFIRG